MEAKEFRLNNLVKIDGVDVDYHYCKITAILQDEVCIEVIGCGEEYLSMSQNKLTTHIEPIHLSEEILLKCGAVLNTKSKIMKCYWLHLKRDLYLNFSDIGTPNFIVSIICFDEGIITDLNIIHNWDYEKEMYLHTLQNIFQSLTNQELEINL